MRNCGLLDKENIDLWPSTVFTIVHYSSVLSGDCRSLDILNSRPYILFVMR